MLYIVNSYILCTYLEVFASGEKTFNLGIISRIHIFYENFLTFCILCPLNQ